MPYPRPVFWVFAAAVAVVYALVILDVTRSEYSLVDDYRAFTLLHIGVARDVLVETLVDWHAPDAWLYRPLPDAVSYTLASLLQHHPGTWHTLLILVRLACVALVFAIARKSASSVAAACAAAAYFAFFPALPELHLMRVEGWLTATLSAALLGWISFEKSNAESFGRGVITALAFVASTISKEIVAPILLVLLVLLARHYWRRGTAARAMLVVMTIAVMIQFGRFLLVFHDPYTRSGSVNGVMNLAKNAFWVAKVMMLATTSFPLVSLALIVAIIAGAFALRSQPPIFAMGISMMLALSVAMAIIAPYPAIRYLYPAALFLVPLLAIGFPPRETWAMTIIIALAVFGGAQLVAQAASMRACSRADWELLRMEASTISSGRDVVVIADADFERGLWMRAELVGVDPRWAFLTYVAQQYEREKPVKWPLPPPGGPVNLTGLVHGRGRFMTVAPLSDTAPDTLVVDANPLVVPAGYRVVRQIDFRRDDALAPSLEAFGRVMRVINPRFRYASDLGEVGFPGYSWPLLRRIVPD